MIALKFKHLSQSFLSSVLNVFNHSLILSVLMKLSMCCLGISPLYFHLFMSQATFNTIATFFPLKISLISLCVFTALLSQEQKLALQSRSKDSHLNQLGEVEKRFSALSRQCAMVKQAHDKLQQNGNEWMDLMTECQI